MTRQAPEEIARVLKFLRRDPPAFDPSQALKEAIARVAYRTGFADGYETARKEPEED